jgi:hypothetical protein
MQQSFESLWERELRCNRLTDDEEDSRRNR